MFAKIIKKALSKYTPKIVNYDKGELLANENYITRYLEDTEVVCSADHADYIMKILDEVCRYLSVLEVHFSDHIKTVYHHTEKFYVAYIASTICIKDLEEWKGASGENQEKLIANLVYLTLMAKEFQENKKFTGRFSRYTRKRSKELYQKAKEMVYQGSLFLLKEDWADVVVSETNPARSRSLSSGGLDAEMYFEMEHSGTSNSSDDGEVVEK